MPAHASPDISHVQWLDVSKDPMLFIDSQVVLSQGERIDGVCHYTVRLQRKVSEPTVGALEIGRDDVSCVDVLRQGHVVSSSASSIPTNKPSGDPCANERFTWWDFIPLKLNEVTTYGCFLYTGQYVGNCTTSAPTVWWNTASGWHNLGPGDNSVSYNSNDTQCYASTKNNFVHYAGTGCWTASTYIYYQPNRLVMYGNGSVGSGTTSWATGACLNQIHSSSSL